MGFDPHLDANLLAAWLEGGLTERQRARLVRHIGDCEGCRMWAASAQTAGAALPRRDAAPPRRLVFVPVPSVFRRWQAPLGLAASVALVAAVVWRLPPTSPARPAALAARIRVLAAGKLPAAPLPQPRLQAHAPAAVPRPTSFGVSSAATAHALPPLPKVTTPTRAMQAPVHPRIDFAPLLTGFQDQPELPVAGSSVAAWDGAVNLGSGKAVASPAVAITTAAPGTPGAAAWPFATGFAGGGTHDGPLAPSVASGLGWAISRGGEVLRSIGAGMWQAVPLVPGVHFRALTEIGDAVWAGGRADQLYFSPDHGSHWRAVRLPKLSAHPAPLRSISFYDVHHGTVIAEDGRVWVTSDGGSSWTAE